MVADRGDRGKFGLGSSAWAVTRIDWSESEPETGRNRVTYFLVATDLGSITEMPKNISGEAL